MAYHTLDSTEDNPTWEKNTDCPGYVRTQTANAKFYEYRIQLICLYFSFHVGSRVRDDENPYLYVSDKVFYYSLMVAFFLLYK